MKLTIDTIARLKGQGMTNAAIGRLFGVSGPRISQIFNGYWWRGMSNAEILRHLRTKNSPDDPIKNRKSKSTGRST